MNYLEQIKLYQPKSEQEQIDQQTMIDFIERNPDALYRENTIGHITSSAIITNIKHDKVLFAYHNIYNSWAWTGGHNDGDPDLLHVAIKEAKEETGVTNIEALTPDIVALDIIHVQNHMKNGIYVGDHLHLNVTYVLVADETDELQINEAENSGVQWFKIDEVLEYVNEERIKPVYQKVFDYIKKFR